MSKSLVQALASRPASRNKGQAKFDRLIREIEQLREQLQQWQQFDGHFRARIVSELEPERQRWCERRRDMVFLIDELLTTPPVGRQLGRVQRAKLADLLTDLASAVLGETPDDAALGALFDRYSDVSRQELDDATLDMTRQMLAGLGVDVAADEVTSLGLEDLLAHASEDIFGRIEAEEMRQNEAAEVSQTQRQASGDRRTAAAQARKEQAEREVSQSIREVYRKLASSLHPDREPDAQERTRKTALMQRVNQAYEARDLLTLLSLQIEMEQISAYDLAAVSGKRIDHYNEVLTEQRNQLRDELASIAMHFSSLRPDLMLRADMMTPQLVDSILTADIKQLRRQITELEVDLERFRDRKYLGDWLKGYRLDPRRDKMECLEEMASMMSLFDELAAHMPPAPAGRNSSGPKR